MIVLTRVYDLVLCVDGDVGVSVSVDVDVGVDDDVGEC